MSKLQRKLLRVCTKPLDSATLFLEKVILALRYNRLSVFCGEFLLTNSSAVETSIQSYISPIGGEPSLRIRMHRIRLCQGSKEKPANVLEAGGILVPSSTRKG